MKKAVAIFLVIISSCSLISLLLIGSLITGFQSLLSYILLSVAFNILGLFLTALANRQNRKKKEAYKKMLNEEQALWLTESRRQARLDKERKDAICKKLDQKADEYAEYIRKELGKELGKSALANIEEPPTEGELSGFPPRVEESRPTYSKKTLASGDLKGNSTAHSKTAERSLLYVGYETPDNFRQRDPWKYPVVKFPNPGCIVRSYSEGCSKRSGYLDPVLEDALKNDLDAMFEVTADIRLNTGNTTRPYEPDIALIDHHSGLNVRVDIEIDEPYGGITRHPTHCFGDDEHRDNYFLSRGWIVIRFTEYQAHRQLEECVNFVHAVLSSVGLDIDHGSDHLDFPDSAAQWSVLQAQQWEKQRWREEYLQHEFELQQEPDKELSWAHTEQEKHEEQEVNQTEPGRVEVVEPLAFNLRNAHKRDSRVRFYPTEHIYSIDGITATSASTLVSRFFDDFDPDMAIANMGPNHPLFGLDPEEIKQHWRQNGENAASAGTELHRHIENYFLEQEYSDLGEMSHFLSFMEDHHDLAPYRTEWRVFHEDYSVAGTIDFLAENIRGFDMYDWKRSRKVVDQNGEPITINSFGRTGRGPLQRVDDTSFNRYCVQQSLYRIILERKYDIQLNQMYLVVLHPHYDRYYKCQVPFLKREAESILSCV